MKIAVCVKQVPDATVHKRIDPTTKRLDRSGEATLNPDRPERGRGGAPDQGSPGRRGRPRVAGAGESRRVAPQGARNGSRPRAPRLGRCRCRLGPARDGPHPRRRAREGGAGPRPLRPGVGGRRRSRALGGSRGEVRSASDLAGRSADARGRKRARKAANRARIRHDHGTAPRCRRRLRRDQRAPLPLAQGDHGSQDEAAGDPVAGRRRSRGGVGRRSGCEDCRSSSSARHLRVGTR